LIYVGVDSSSMPRSEDGGNVGDGIAAGIGGFLYGSADAPFSFDGVIGALRSPDVDSSCSARNPRDVRCSMMYLARGDADESVLGRRALRNRYPGADHAGGYERYARTVHRLIGVLHRRLAVVVDPPAGSNGCSVCMRKNPATDEHQLLRAHPVFTWVLFRETDYNQSAKKRQRQP
jgi:hypothetical protein